MIQLDDQEREIIRELIRNPRLSDNEISRRTNIPVKTVNRKRKNLEAENILGYYVDVNHNATGTGQLSALEMFIIELKHGVTRTEFIEKMDNLVSKKVNLKHVKLSLLGERNGHLLIITILESGSKKDLLEIFNANIVSELKQMFGEDAIHKTESLAVTAPIRIMHNYLPMINMKDGKIREDWPKERIFVD